MERTGKFRWAGAKVFPSHALEGQTVGLRDARELRPDGAGAGLPAGRYWAVRFAAVELGVFDAGRGRLLTAPEARHLG